MTINWIGPYPIVEDQKRYADDITVQELVRLRVENERYRSALKEIQKICASDAAEVKPLHAIIDCLQESSVALNPEDYA